MKHIKKGPQPQALINWRAVNAAIPDAQYGTHGFPKVEVQQSLLQEQGWICAYTMIRVDESSSHIEHLKPRTVSRAEGNLAETALYTNMVACYPREHVAGDAPVVFGAIFRKSKWDKEKFVSPLMAKCETAFMFRTSGAIEPAIGSDEKAKWMIEALALDAATLTEQRCRVIETIGVSLNSEDPVSAKEAKQIMSRICEQDGQGRFHPYCVAIKHAAKEYLRLIEKLAKRTTYIRAASKKRRRK